MSRLLDLEHQGLSDKEIGLVSGSGALNVYFIIEQMRERERARLHAQVGKRGQEQGEG